MNKLIPLVLFVLLAAQPLAAQPEMADRMRADGKIYVVVAIILIVVLGLIGYLFFLHRKVSKLENMLREKTEQNK